MTNMKQTITHFLGIFDAIHRINEKYKHPRIKMTPMVRISLLALRLYLFFILVILLYKFISMAIGGQ
jgi:hypothetical protein